MSYVGRTSARSAAEEHELKYGELSSKYRQLPCRSFVISGTCPYRDRCDYLHDPRCLSHHAKCKTKKRNEDGTTLDAFYWPNLSQVSVVREKFRPDVVFQQYHVCEPKYDQYYRHDSSLYSLWNHFTEYCAINEAKGGYFPTHESFTIRNKFTNKLRLATFVDLSNSTRSPDSITMYSC